MGSKLINNKVLHLVLKKKWYEMEERGEKTEEYRDISPYWRKRLVDPVTHHAKPFSHVCFHCGYTQRVFINRIDSITIGKGHPEWGAPEDRSVFIISHHFESMKVTRKMLVDRMASIYRDSVDKGVFKCGLCFSYRMAYRELFRDFLPNNIFLYPSVLRLLPAFVPPLGFQWGDFWWYTNDVASRFKFCEMLADLYKDDETDLTLIVRGYLALYCSQKDREAYAKKYLECYEKNIPFNPLKFYHYGK